MSTSWVILPIERYDHVDYLVNNALPHESATDGELYGGKGWHCGSDGGMTRQMIYHGDNGWKLEL